MVSFVLKCLTLNVVQCKFSLFDEVSAKEIGVTRLFH